MKDSEHQSSISRLFLKQGVSVGVLHWLVFRISLSKDNWREQVREDFSESYVQQVRDQAIITRWMQAQPEISAASANPSVLALVGAVLGILAMSGALSYSGSAPVNIWVLLGLFAFFPLVMCFASLLSWFAMSRRAALPLPAPIRKIFFSNLHHLGAASKQYTNLNLLQPWVYWQFQWLAMAFQFAAILCFFVIIFFKDIAFGWSSTIVSGGGWMTDLIHNLALPWAWLHEPPSKEFIEGSRFFRGEGFGHTSSQVEVLGEWWTYLLATMVYYGFLPRVMLVYWMRSRVKTLLLNEILSSGDVERFLNVAKFVESTSAVESELALQKNELADPATIEDGFIIAWQYRPKMQVDKILGQADWLEDESWILNNFADLNCSIKILVQSKQTPTAELADIFELAKSVNADLNFELNIQLDKNDDMESSRVSGQIKSWQYFAKQHQLAIQLVKESKIS